MKDSGVKPSGTSTSRTSLTLLEKVRQNDRAAWERLVSLYTPLVYYWCNRAGLQRADAEEVGQEVFTAVARSLATFSHDQAGASFRGWLREITRCEILDHRPPPGGVGAGGSSAQELLAGVPTIGEDDALLSVEKSLLYSRAVELLESSFEPKTRRAFWLLLGGASAKEVAAELQMSASAVYTAKSKVLTRLREEFGAVLDLKAAPADPPAE
jgi:RNA polymerase sigma-70 factor (ECF subfamily)